MIIFAFAPILLAIKTYGAKAGAFILGSRVAQIAIVIALAATLYQCKVGGLESDLEDAQEALAVVEHDLAQCEQASESQQVTIAVLERAQEANLERYRAAVERGDRLAQRVIDIQQENEGRQQNEVREAINAGSTDDCGLSPMPDNLRLRVRP